MKYYLPTIYSDKEGFTELALLKESFHNSSKLVINFSRCRFFDANMAAPLQAILLSLNANVSIEECSYGVETILRKNSFLLDYGYSILPDNKKTVLPYQRFQFSDSQLFNEYLNQNLLGKGIPKMSLELDKKFRKNIFEIFENCVIHSQSNQGIFVCGQFFPQQHRLDLTISDAGIGIRNNVRQKIPDISSIEAIRWAMQQGNTTKTGSQPGGFGLSLLKKFIELNQGKVQIVSRQGYYELSGGKEKFEKLDSDFLGTTINLEIRTNDNNSYCLRSEIDSTNIF